MPTTNRPGFTTEGLELTPREWAYLLQIRHLIGVECFSPAADYFDNNVYLVWTGGVRRVPGSNNLHLMCYHRRYRTEVWRPPRGGVSAMRRRLIPVEEP